MRLKTIDRYVVEIRKKYLIQNIVANIKLVNAMRPLSRRFAAALKWKYMRLNQIYICQKVSKVMKRKFTRHRGMTEILRNRLR